MAISPFGAIVLMVFVGIRFHNEEIATNSPSSNFRNDGLYKRLK